MKAGAHVINRQIVPARQNEMEFFGLQKDMVPEEPDAMAPDEEYQLTPAGRRERIGPIDHRAGDRGT